MTVKVTVKDRKRGEKTGKDGRANIAGFRAILLILKAYGEIRERARRDLNPRPSDS